MKTSQLSGFVDKDTESLSLDYYEDLGQKLRLWRVLPSLDVAKESLSDREQKLSKELDCLHVDLENELNLSSEWDEKLEQQKRQIQELEQKLQKERNLIQNLDEILRPKLIKKITKALVQKLEKELKKDQKIAEEDEVLLNPLEGIKKSLEGGLIEQLNVIEEIQYLRRNRIQQLEKKIEEQKIIEEVLTLLSEAKREQEFGMFGACVPSVSMSATSRPTGPC